MNNFHHPLYHTTAVYRGKSYITRECVTGRLFFLDMEKKTETVRGAVIVVITPHTESAYMTADDSAFSAVAAVFVGEMPSDALCAYASRHGIPFLILGKLSTDHDGRVAILDSRTATLFVDPDLETLSRYARALRLPQGVSFSPILLSRSQALPLRPTVHTLFRHATLVSADTLSFAATQGEEVLFEALRELAEESIGAPWILPIRVYDSDTTDLLRERFRALLRAAVFAPFSLLLEGLFCADELTKTIPVLDEVCKELTLEGREHDRHVPVGIAVESFLLLHELPHCPSADYVCLDWDRLLRSVLPPFAGKAPSIETKDAFCAMLRTYTDALSIPLCARTVHLPITQSWPTEAMAGMGIQSLFVPEESIPTWRDAETESSSH